jgi:hypothetical protein
MPIKPSTNQDEEMKNMENEAVLTYNEKRKFTPGPAQKTLNKKDC